ncbi:uncharacterized protein V6R79_005441 [Siganus canaliculatus]
MKRLELDITLYNRKYIGHCSRQNLCVGEGSGNTSSRSSVSDNCRLATRETAPPLVLLVYSYRHPLINNGAQCQRSDGQVKKKPFMTLKRLSQPNVFGCFESDFKDCRRFVGHQKSEYPTFKPSVATLSKRFTFIQSYQLKSAAFMFLIP